MIKPGLCFFQKQVRYGFAALTYFELHSLACKKVTTVQIKLKFIPSFTDQTHILLTRCIPAKLSRIKTVLSDIPHEGDTMYLLKSTKL